MSIIVAHNKQGSLYSPRSIIVLICVSVVIWSLLRNLLVPLSLVVVIGLFIKGFKNPVWALGSLLLCQFTINSYMMNTPFTTISLRLVLSMLVLILMAKPFLNHGVSFGPAKKSIVIPAFLLIVVAFIANIMNSGFDLAFQDFRGHLVGFLLLVFIATIVDTRRKLELLFVIAAVILTISAAVGIMQHFNLLGMASATLDPGILMGSDARVPGIAETELELSYAISAAVLIGLSMVVVRGFRFEYNRYIIIAVVIMVIGIYFTYTRSALLAVIIGAISMFFFIKSKIKWHIMLIILIVLVGVVVEADIFGRTYFSGRSENNQLESSVARDILWQASIAIILDNPVLGIGTSQFRRLSPKYSGEVDQSLIQWEQDRYWSFSTLGSFEPHNDYLNTWVSYGTFAIILHVWLHFAIIAICCKAYTSTKDRFFKGVALSIATALVAFIVNSFYHNLSTDLPILWILSGLALVVAKLTAKDGVKWMPSQALKGKI